MNQISVVVPCRNEVQYIEECVEAIYTARLPENTRITVFIVDGMSNDGTRERINLLQEKHKTLHLLDNKKQLTPFAFNMGIHAAECEYVQIIGARHIISTDYLYKSLEILQQEISIWCVGGRIVNEYLNPTGKVIATAMGTKLGMGLGNFRTLQKSGFTDTVTSPMYPYWVFEKIGFFDEELIRNQDDDFNYRVSKAGGKIYYEHTISLKYYVRGSYRNLWKQFFQYGYWKVYVNKKHKAVTTFRQLIPPLFVLYLILFLSSFFLGGITGYITGFPLLVYLLLTLYVALDCQKKDNTLDFFSLFKTFPILHISYGLGYLRGIIDFLLFKQRPAEHQKEMSR